MALMDQPSNNGRHYDVGDVVEIRAFFSSPGDPGDDPTYIDPLAATCTIKLPDDTTDTVDYPSADGVKEEYTYNGASIVEIRFRYTTTQAGKHRYRVTAAGASASAERAAFNVRSTWGD